MDNIVEINNLSKFFSKKEALKDLTINFKKGKIIGILGPNGSGKTTLLKIIVGFLKPSIGEVLIDGKIPGLETKNIISYLPDRNFLYNWMTVEEAINFYRDFHKDFDEMKANELLESMGLEKSMKIKNLSKGTIEKLNISLVLSRKAKVYILDEPIAGVDPIARDEILDAIINNYNEDSTMIITTHLVRDMERLFDDVLLLKNGQIKLYENADVLREKNNSQIDDLYKEIFGQRE